MHEDTDFSMLYRELSIDATCTLTELRNAYRRRVSQLHPDQGGDAQDTGQLQRLNRLRDAAIDFHRRYGRLPGAPTGAVAPQDGRAAVHFSYATGPDIGPNAMPGLDAPTASHRNRDGTNHAEFGKISRYFIAVAIVGIGVLGWRIAEPPSASSMAYDDAGSEPPAAAVQATEPETAEPRAQAFIVAGMDQNDVRHIQGEPLVIHEQRWEYDSSWVAFRCGRVVGWYSSTSRPLHTRSARGPADAMVASTQTALSTTGRLTAGSDRLDPDQTPLPGDESCR